MATARVTRNLSHDNVTYNVGDDITADKAVLEGLSKAGVVEHIADVVVEADKPVKEEKAEAPAKDAMKTNTKTETPAKQPAKASK